MEVFVKINTDFQLIKLERAFASKFEKEGATPRYVPHLMQYFVCNLLLIILLRLLYKGERFTEHDTPESLNMVDCGM